ncbi:transcriptional regulator [Streptomyces sp. NPDC050617]|uniref:transcriptional regulator n=1 Tax=Streptomyces sp. NPDC050617 TaxID=3154628 RepID=UPI0034335106
MGQTGGRLPNTLLSHFMDRAQLSNAQLAQAVTAGARAAGHRHINPDESRVRRWRAGECPRPPVPQLIAQALGARLALPLTPADVGLPGPQQMPGHGVDLPWQHAATIAAIAALTRSDLMLPHTRTSHDAAQIHSADALLEPLRRWPSAKPATLPHTAARPGMLGTAQVESIEALTAAFRDADNRHGGVLSRRAVVAQMSEINDLLATASYTEATGRRLFRAVADLGSVAGWMSFDAGAHVSAQRLFVTAVHAASEGGDRQLGAHILQCMARQMSHLGHVEDALELVALAQYGARRHAGPGTRAILAALHSRFSAMRGDLEESQRAAGEAEDAFTRIRPDDEPPHTAFFDEAELCATLGVAHQIAAKHASGPHRTQRADQSLTLLNNALRLRPAGRVRSRAFDHIGLARTHLAVGELAGACQEATTALTIAEGLHSTRIADRLSELHEETEPHAASGDICALRERLEDAVPTTR